MTDVTDGKIIKLQVVLSIQPHPAQSIPLQGQPTSWCCWNAHSENADTMDFNVKKLASDAGVFFTRAVQVWNDPMLSVYFTGVAFSRKWRAYNSGGWMNAAARVNDWTNSFALLAFMDSYAIIQTRRFL